MINRGYRFDLTLILLALLLTFPVFADPTADDIGQTEPTTVDTLSSLIAQKEVIDADISTLNIDLKNASSDTEKEQLKIDLDSKGDQAQKISRSIENLAASTDLSSLRAVKEEAFNIEKEVFSLIEPTLKEMRHLTYDVRVKADLRDRIEFVNKRIPVVTTALTNIGKLKVDPANKTLARHIDKLKNRWTQQLKGYETELNSATMQLEKFELDEKVREANEPSFFKTFFEKRGWVLLKALGAIILVVLIAKLIHNLISKVLKGFQKANRSVKFRIIDLVHRGLTVIFMILAPMFVFYLAEDWVLFTLSMLVLIGMAWSLREAIPRYWEQIQIFLNIGSVREGERLLMDGLPWEVKNINVFSTLHNPRANITKRVKLSDLEGLNSRPAEKSEPWFPCQKGDWVILSDGVRGKVVGISLELVELIQRGGARCTYTLSNFLDASPQNLSLNFRIKERLGISYSNQKTVTTEAPSQLKDYLGERLRDDGYGEVLLNLNVEFEKANDSSLDLVIIADFKGESADIYNRLRRAIQRYCVDAATKFDWEIPFPQVTFHNPATLEAVSK
jgi:small-conductance mechanosensitive channel